MRFIVFTLSLVAFFVAYGIGAEMVSAGTVSAGNEQPSQSTSGGGGVAKPWTDQSATTYGGVDAFGPNRPDTTDPNFDPTTDYYAILAYDNTDDAGFEDENELIAEAQGFSAGEVEWRGAFSGSMTCHVKTINAPQNPDHPPYRTWAEASLGASIDPSPLPAGGTSNAGHKHDDLEIVAETTGELAKSVRLDFTQPDPNDPNVTLPYRTSTGAGTENKVKFWYKVTGSIKLEAIRPEVEVAAYVHTTSVSASLTAWDPSTGSVINKADGTPGVWTMN